MPTTLCGSLSLHPVGLGAAMHRAAYEALGLDYAYVPFGVTSERLAGALVGMRALGIRGFGVSMPFKIEVLPLLDRIDPLAARIGACNTIVNDEGVLVGHNTDAAGAADALEAEIGSLEARTCLVLGAGGAARAVAVGLSDRGARVVVSNRTPSKAEEIAGLAGGSTLPWEVATRSASGADVVVNASSAGMQQKGEPGELDSPLGDEAVRPGLVVMDIVYKPLETRLLARARQLGARTVHGGRMLLFQAARQFRLYTGRDAPLDSMGRALEVLVGSAS